MKLIRAKSQGKRPDEELAVRRAGALTVTVCVDVALHAVYIALLALLARDGAFIAAHAAGAAVVIAVFAVSRRGLIGESAVMMLLLCEAGALSGAWVALYGFPVLVYCHVLCFIVTGRVMGAISAGMFRALHITVCGFAAAFIVIGLTVTPISSGEGTGIYAAVTIAAVCVLRAADAIVNKKQMIHGTAWCKRSPAGVRDETMRDSLTGLLNRRYLEYSSGNYEFMSSTTPCTVAMLDLDLFKTINDTYNHMVGDQMLLYFSAFLKKNLRASDHIVRWGGDKFFIIFTNTDARQAFAVLSNLRDDFKASPMPVGESFIPITFTAGVCQMKDGMTMQAAVETTDALLYAGKSAGRDRVVSD